MATGEAWKYILVCLAAAILSVAVKNYVVYLFYDTTFCTYLCPSIFGERPFEAPLLLEQLFGLQTGIQEWVQAGFKTLWPDPFCLSTALLVAPVLEETLYRGPLYLSRTFSSGWTWWIAATLLSVLFALSHGRAGLSLMPLVVLGTGSAWLVMRTQRFWPSLALHTLFNFYFASTLLCSFLFAGD